MTLPMISTTILCGALVLAILAAPTRAQTIPRFPTTPPCPPDCKCVPSPQPPGTRIIFSHNARNPGVCASGDPADSSIEIVRRTWNEEYVAKAGVPVSTETAPINWQPVPHNKSDNQLTPTDAPTSYDEDECLRVSRHSTCKAEAPAAYGRLFRDALYGGSAEQHSARRHSGQSI